MLKTLRQLQLPLLTTNANDNKAFALTGKEAINHTEVAAKLSSATGLSISYVDITPEDFKNHYWLLDYQKIMLTL